MRGFGEMTQEQVAGEALKAIPSYLETIRGTGEFKFDLCFNRELRALEELFKRCNGLDTWKGFDARQRADFEDAIAPVLPAVRERTVEIRDRYLAGRRVSDIRFATASAVILKAFESRRMTATVFGQRHRAKVLAQLPGGSCLRVYGRYRDIGIEGLMDGILDAVESVGKGLEHLGRGASVQLQ